MKNRYQQFSIKLSSWAGSPKAFMMAILTEVIWLLTGPIFHFSNTWLIAITVITDLAVFLMVFSIQNTQNRDSKAVQLKLNELIVANNKARDTFVGLESLTDEELSDIDEEFKKLLSSLEVAPAMHALHKKLAREKELRDNSNNLTSNIHKAEHLVGSLLNPLGTRDTAKK
jgi:low affinity Fe/Cu permease